MADKKEFSTILTRANDAYLPLIEKQLQGHNIVFNDYAKKCVLNAISAINEMLDTAGVSWNDPALDQGNVTKTLLNVASLELNPAATPAECYFQLRNVKVKVKDETGKLVDRWKKKIEFGIQSDGNDAILARFGRDVEKVYPFWVVRENDVFEYPKYNGLEMTPPKWEPHYLGKAVRVVYPILHKDMTLHFYISEREDVKKNLLAHINNNMMNETFGICADRYKATQEQLAQINAKKRTLKDRASSMELNEILSDEQLAPYISPSWKEDFSSEEMIIRKMRNNITKKIPKDFGASIVQENYMEATDEAYRNAKENITSRTATVLIDDNSSPAGEIGGTDKSNGGESIETLPNTEAVTESEIDPSTRTKPDFN